MQPPTSSAAPDAFGDPRIADKVAAKLAALGVRLDCNVKLAGLESDEAQNLSACLLELPRASPNAPANVQAQRAPPARSARCAPPAAEPARRPPRAAP